MKSLLLRVLRRVGVPLVSLVAVAALAGTAHANPVVGPNQNFIGVVNGATVNATVLVLCPGPLNTGHPVNDNAEAILDGPSPSPVVPGFTGSSANALQVLVSTSSLVEQIGTIKQYGVLLPFPSTLTLPCSGVGDVVFEPTPGSPTSHPAIVNVRFISIGG
jgi:hypothetical protein